MEEKIDFVIIWVDGNDKKWREEKDKYETEYQGKKIDDREIRYRDWDNLKYWFRAAEKYAPWVNNIYFVTYGHLPNWLNTNHPKLKIIKHEDYIPKEYLPTFSSHPIELNLHRIKGLEEKFVYFNDDMFLNNYVEKEEFFKNGLPCESAVIDANIPNRKTGLWQRIIMNNTECINSHFNMKKSISNNRLKWYNLKYGIDGLYRNLVLDKWSNFPGIKFYHLPSSFLKSTFEEVWKNEEEVLNRVSKNKFRTKDDVNQYVMKDWQLASGKFYPRNVKFGKAYDINKDTINEILEDLKTGKHKTIVINDSEEVDDFEKQKNAINEAFETRLNQKSSFEK